MLAAARGDTEALADLIRALAPEVYRFLAATTGDPHEAAELMEEAFVRAARSVGRYEGEDDARVWVFASAREVAAEAPPGAPTGEPGGTEADTAGSAMSALRSLEGHDREIAVARDVLGWDRDTIARVLGIPSEEVLARLAAVREAMMREGSMR